MVDTSPETAHRTLHTAPLSFQQQSLWFLHALGDQGAYNELEGVRLRGRLDVAALRAAFQHLVQRHELLRTVFVSRAGVPSQVVLEAPKVVLPILDLSRTSPEAREAEVGRLARLDAQRSFDLEERAPLRLRLVRLAPEEHVLMVTVHHLCGDGWSLGILSRELEATYRALVGGERPHLPELRAQYRDYAEEQRSDDARGRRADQVAYWKKQLAGLPPLLDLPLDRARPAVAGSDGASVTLELGRELTEKTKAFGRRFRATPFMTTLAAFTVLLRRYSRMEDFAVGTPFANRGRSEFEPLLGFFANTLVLRADLSGDPTIEELLGRTRATTLAAYEHAEVPFEKVVEAVQPPRDLSYNPIFQVMFSWQPGHTFANMALTDLKVEPLGVAGTRSKFDVNLVLWESPTGGITTRWEYDAALFEAATVERMAGHLKRLLERMIEDPARRVSELPLLSEEETSAMLARWSTRGAWAPEETIHQRFRRMVARSPDAVALVHEGAPMSYRELDRRSDALANHLRGLGVGPERLVGMFLERSPAMIVAILGILKAGGAYVPMDPVYPAARVAGIAADAGLAALLTQSSLLADLPVVEAPRIVLDAEWDTIERAPARPGPEATPENAAYVIYTSGSTGVPKGVLIPHHHVLRLFQATDAWFSFGPDDVWSVFHSYAFDFSVWEIWGGLLYGGRVVLVPYLTSRSPEDFYALLRSERVTVLNQTPSAFQQLSQAEERVGAAADLALRLVIFGGEALEFNTLGSWFERHGDQRPQLVNMYGITETTVHVTYRPVSLADLRAKSRSMIGEPIPDLELLVLDERLRPVPVGVPGELFVGGAGVARGYLRRPELNAYRFLQRPDDPARRLYRSGDLVRAHANGDIEYLGRIDHQVQLRGFRVELGEIEAGLTEVAGVREAIALIREDAPGDKRIVAYCVLREGAAPSIDALREHLRGKLPSYMVPSAIVPLPSLPLTPNGKVNRGALPKPVYQGAAVVPPRTATEAALLAVWVEVLEGSSFGVRDDFFDAGGHSLLAVQVLALVEARLGRKLPLAALFRNPTVEGLARVIDEGGAEWSPIVTLRAKGGSPPLFCVPGSGAMTVALRPLASTLAADRPFVALERPGLDGVRPPLATVEGMADEAVAAIRKVQPAGPYTLGGHSFGAWVAFEVARRLLREGEAVASLVVLDMPAPPRTPAAAAADPGRLLDRLLGILGSMWGFAPGDPEALRALPLDRQLDRVQQEMRDAGLLPAGSGIEQLRGMMRVLEADERALAAFAATEGAGALRIAVVRTEERWEGALGARAEPGDPTLGWGRLTSRAPTVRAIAGTHATMLASSHVAELAAALDAALGEDRR